MRTLPWSRGAAEKAWRQAECGTCRDRQREIDRLERQVEQAERRLEHADGEIKQLRERVKALEGELEKAHRAGKRQAAPFSKGKREPSGRPPGRRPGEAYGRKARRAVPTQIDREIEVFLPEACPHCGGPLSECETADQYHEELPEPRPVVTRFRVHVGRCSDCGRHVQGRHPEQTSDALGVAAVQVGPRATALVCYLNKVIGASMGKTAAILQTVSGITLTTGGISQALDRVARKSLPTYEALVEAVRHSPAVTADESGWKVGGDLHWLWVFVTKLVTVYRIQPGRGFKEAAEVLGADFCGVLERDGWAPYRQFTQAAHQSCLAHLTRRCREMLDIATDEDGQIPLTVERLLKDGLEVRDRRDAGELAPAAVAAEVEGLEQRLDEVLGELDQTQHNGNRRLLKHLGRERDAIFTFLRQTGVQATNWQAEQDIRPAVVNRKVWGGNRSLDGAHTQEILVSVLRTAQKQGQNPRHILVELLRSPTPVVAPLLPAVAAPAAPG